MPECILKPLHLLILFLAVQLNAQQRHVIDCLQVANPALR
jgi:hypothetical protein